MPRSRLIAAVAVAVTLLLLPAGISGAAEPPPAALTIQGVETAGYPTVRMTVAVPVEIARTAEQPRFTVRENGSAIRDVTVEPLEREAAPNFVVLVVDASGSMEGKPLEDAKAAAVRFLDLVGDDARIAVVSISDDPRVLTNHTEDRAALTSAIDSVYARGETALYDSLMTAASLGPLTVPPDARRSIVLLSDGGDTVSDTTFAKTMDTLKGSGAQLYAVAIESDEYDPEALRLLAAGTGGRLISVADTGKLAGLFEGIATEISGGWMLTYTSPRPRTKDLEVDITAEAGGGSATGALAIPNPQFAEAVSGAGPGAKVLVARDDPLRLALIAVLAFLAVATLAAGALLIFVREPTTLGQLKYYDQLHAEPQGTSGMTEQVRERIVGAVGEAAGKRGLLQLVANRLEAAGLPLRPAEYITVHLLAVVASGLLVELLSGSFPLALMTVGSVTVVPIMLLSNAVTRRRIRFEAQLPDVLSMIAGSLRGGWGVGQAIALVTQEAASPSCDEFRRVDAETRLGMPLDRSLQSMADRLESSDFQAAVTSISIQREVGGNLAEVLDVVSGTIRERESLRRQVSALTADGRISAYILVGLPFAILTILLLVSPDYLEPLYTTPFGAALLVMGVLMLLVGAGWMWRVTRIEV